MACEEQTRVFEATLAEIQADFKAEMDALARDTERQTEELSREFENLSCTRFRRHQVRCFMEQEVRHGEKAVYAGVQA
jgi:hypothetical protein